MEQVNNQNSGSYVRVLHAVSEAPAVDVYVDGMLSATNLEFSYFTNYVLLPAGEHSIDIYEAGTEEMPLLSGQWDLPPEEYFTVIVFGSLEDLKLGFVEDSDGDVDKDESEVRFVHVFSDGPTVTVLADKKVWFDGLEYANMTEYKEVYPSVYDVYVKEMSNGAPVLNFQLQALDGYPITVYIVGKKPEKNGILPLVDGKNANSFYHFITI